MGELLLSMGFSSFYCYVKNGTSYPKEYLLWEINGTDKHPISAIFRSIYFQSFFYEVRKGKATFYNIFVYILGFFIKGIGVCIFIFF